MVVSWMLYATLVGGLLGAAALAADRVVRDRRLPSRWVWVAALGASLAVPLTSALVASGPAASTPSGAAPLPAPLVVPLEAVGNLEARATPFLARVEGPILRLWALASLALSVLLLGAMLRLRHARRGWKEEVLDGTTVLVSPEVGPAVLGVLRHRIVLPRWVLARGQEARSLIMAHEREHVRARDPLMVLLAALPAVLFPWHLPLWWQLRRLRLAVEMDCDERVLRSATPGVRRRYGRLLLEVGKRAGRSHALAAAFSESPSLLERRIRGMIAPPPTGPHRRAPLLVALGTVSVVAACLVPGPDGASVTGPTVEEAPAVTLSTPSVRPRFTPYSVAPEVINTADVTAALERAYPAALRQAGIGGRATVWFYIDETGRVLDRRLDESSGHRALDEAALGVAGVMRFSPALNRDQPVPVWVSIPITFQVGRADAGAEADGGRAARRRQELERLRASRESQLAERAGEGEAAAPDGPTFTPYTVAPEVSNRDEVGRALAQEYPPLLRDAGIGGKVTVWFHIDETGRVTDLRLNEGSGHEALDEAALRVARVMRFTPARNGDRETAVWVSVPITFHVR